MQHEIPARKRRVQRVQELRRSNAAVPIPPAKRYKRRPKHVKKDLYDD